MYPSTQSKGPSADTGYVPYVYQAGLHQRHGLLRLIESQRPGDASEIQYDFSSDLVASRHPNHPWTVEQIVQHGYLSIPKGDPVTAILSDKEHTSWLGLDDVISQVRRRYEIYEQSMTQIELAKCASANAIYQHEAYVGPADARQMETKHKAIQGLYEQQRGERTTLWKDVSRLKSMIPESAQLYLTAHRRQAILRQESGDSE